MPIADLNFSGCATLRRISGKANSQLAFGNLKFSPILANFFVSAWLPSGKE
jgi:hypothetical protein